ncbi:MAG: class I SAM-dependent methyltransferase [Helicobacter sp.]|nr:class I SAM-dependent methyltransferase [Helicobacter sp.]
MTLFQCQDCGCMQNATFDDARIDYENYSLSLIDSPAYHSHIQALISILHEKYQIAHAKIVEIGCGDAHALYTIAKATDSKGIGYDPSFEKRKHKLAQNQPDDFHDYVTILSEYFSESAIHKDTDVFLCRHVLEHIPEPLKMLDSIHAALSAGGGGRFFACIQPLLPCKRLWIDEERRMWHEVVLQLYPKYLHEIIIRIPNLAKNLLCAAPDFVFDANDAIRESRECLFDSYWIHCNARGNALCAQYIAQKLYDLGLVLKPTRIS